MSKFYTTLKSELIDSHGSGIWQLTGPLIYWSDLLNCVIVVPAGFVTDYASVPRIGAIYAWLGNINHLGATLHDFLYSQLCKLDITREQADDVLFEAGVVSFVPQHKAWVQWSGVRIFGERYWKAA